MNPLITVRIGVSFLFLTLPAIAKCPPHGWIAHGHHIANHTVGVDRMVAHSGKTSSYIQSASPDGSGFRTIMQTIEAGKLCGKRVRLSGFLKTREVNFAGLWMRVEGRPPAILAFDFSIGARS